MPRRKANKVSGESKQTVNIEPLRFKHAKVRMAAAIHYARSGDDAAVAGIRARFASVMLPPNTRIRTTNIDGELVEVDVLSGYHAGRSCWVSYSFLRTE